MSIHNPLHPLFIIKLNEGVTFSFIVMRSRLAFGGTGGRRVQFSYFALSDSFLAVLRTSGRVFMFCATGVVFDGTEGAGFNFHVLRSQTHFGRYRKHRVQFLCFSFSDSF
jgi:hypothetical protein